MADIKTKICQRCKQEKPLSAFYRKQRDDYVHECLDCRLLTNGGGKPTSKTALSSELATLELTLLNAESSGQDFDDFVMEGLEGGVSPEILTRMKDLWEKTKEIGGEMIAVGKIIVIKIIEFLKANPKLAASLAIGAAVYLLAHAIPFIGPMLAPLLAVITTVFAFGKLSTFDEVVATAKAFFQLLVDIFNAVAARWALSLS